MIIMKFGLDVSVSQRWRTFPHREQSKASLFQHGSVPLGSNLLLVPTGGEKKSDWPAALDMARQKGCHFVGLITPGNAPSGSPGETDVTPQSADEPRGSRLDLGTFYHIHVDQSD